LTFLSHLCSFILPLQILESSINHLTMKRFNLLSINSLILLIAILLSLPNTISAQCDGSCLPQGIGFYTQADVDNFQTNYPDCTVIEGSVGIFNDEITNLNGLNVLTEILGELQVTATSLQNFEGLNNLESIGSNFNVWQAESLVNFTGLESLVSIGGDFDIQQNNSLNSFQGLESLLTIGSNLYFNGNPLVTSMTGLETLESVRSIAIIDNDGLESLIGLESLTQISGSLALTNCVALQSVEGLNNLSSLGLHLTISGCDALTDLSAFSSLTDMNGKLFIAYNDMLESLSGLDNINYENLTGLSIGSNPVLSECEVNSVCGYVNNNQPLGNDGIGGNAPGCNSWEEVQDACVGISIENIVDQEMKIFPNPADDFLLIENPHHIIYTLMIYDMSGSKIILQKISDSHATVDIRGLQQGVYQIIICRNERIYSERLVIL